MRKALAALPGVGHVRLDYETKIATVSVEITASRDDSRLIKALEDADFGGTVTDPGKTPAKTPKKKE